MGGMLRENSPLLTVRRDCLACTSLMPIAPTPSACHAPLDRGQASFGFISIPFHIAMVAQRSRLEKLPTRP